MGRGVAKIDQQAVAEILGDMAGILLNDVRRCRLIGTHNLAQIFGIQVPGQLRGADQITEHHRQLTAFGLGGVADWLRGTG